VLGRGSWRPCGSIVDETGTACLVSPLDFDSQAWLPILLAEPRPPHGGQEHAQNLVWQGLSGSCTTVGQLRRNAVAVHGVKLGAAPDAPPWGEVLACLPPVPVRIQRRAVAARDIHLPPHHHTCQARSVHGGGKPKFPVSVLVPALGLASRGMCREWKAARKRPDGAGHGAVRRIATTSSGPANRPEYDSGWQ
jgi:hypothetical protein